MKEGVISTNRLGLHDSIRESLTSSSEDLKVFDFFFEDFLDDTLSGLKSSEKESSEEPRSFLL